MACLDTVSIGEHIDFFILASADSKLLAIVQKRHAIKGLINASRANLLARF